MIGAVVLVQACESSRLPSLLQGPTAPTQPQTSQTAPPPVPPPSAAGAPAAPAPAEPAAVPGAPQTPSLVPFLTGQATPSLGAATEPPPIVPLKLGSAVRVALLVPLSGPNARLGQAMLNAAQMALFDFSDARFELLVHDTEGTPEGAMSAAGLAIGDGASVILGPLLGPSVRSVAPMARAAGVTVIGFSSDRTITGDGVYTMGFFPEAEVVRVVDHAAARGLTRFAALAPNDAYGMAVVETLKQRAAALGVAVARVQFYDPDGDDFSPVVRELGDYDSRRQALLDQRQQLGETDSDIARRALARLEKLQTIGELPFDALLLADGGKRLLAIAALLPFYDIDPNKVRMLGTGQWDLPGLGTEPALLGGWYAGPPAQARAEFMAQYRETYGGDPHRLATLAYDATALAAVLSRAEGGPDFSTATLTSKSGYWGRDGVFRFLRDGTVERGLAVLEIEARGLKVISPAPESFEAAN